MRGSRNFHERGSNENGNFWSQTRGGPTPPKSRNYLFLGKIFKFQGVSGPLDPRMFSYVETEDRFLGINQYYRVLPTVTQHGAHSTLNTTYILNKIENATFVLFQVVH